MGLQLPLPSEFENQLKQIISDEYDDFRHALDENPPVAIRFNRRKGGEKPEWANSVTPVQWCQDGEYLPERPSFTLTPQLAAGQFYVQDPSSMIYQTIAEKLFPKSVNLRILDLCAAPGGKTTAMINAIQDGSLVVANEVTPGRAQILRENIIKWGYPNVIVTSSSAEKLGKLRESFDIIAIDAPCSGEGMMRKEAEAIAQWSKKLVRDCATLQQSIIDDIMPALRPGGILIYSTCTYNIDENEKNAEYIASNFDLESIDLKLDKEYGIKHGINTSIHCYRFMPHITKGEGLFVAAFRKSGNLKIEDAEAVSKPSKKDKKRKNESIKSAKNGQASYNEAMKWLDNSEEFYPILSNNNIVNALLKAHMPFYEKLSEKAYILLAGIPLAELKGKSIIPQAGLALSTAINQDSFPIIDVSIEEALDYMRRNTLKCPDNTPVGYVLVRYAGLPLGFIKNLGNRSNNLYPTEWRIRNL
jgi:16S rRNA C967 or C1407 C5-methylase (RsmB/RsmF family)/NOL1/NOP2/fmu family ribosome biogenesis protein